MKTTENEAIAHLQHELRTPINHILGYSQLLIEDAGERHLEAFVPAFHQIHNCGRRLLESVQTAFAEKTTSLKRCNLDGFKDDLAGTAAEGLAILAEFECGQRQTLADLQVISEALLRLAEFAGEGGSPFASETAKPSTELDLESRENIPTSSVQREATIMIADDDSRNRVLLRHRLESDGHRVVEAANGLEVLAGLKEQPCDLVLLDVIMPGMDGFQTLEELKKHSELRQLPVIMISALDELSSAVRCIELGAEDYLPKPFNRVLLRARIGASLEKKWLRDSERQKTEELEQALRLLEQAQSQLEIQASQDALTRLANRRAVDSHLEFRSKREIPFSVIYIDLNGFKKINDTYGHQAGDDLLQQVGDRLRAAFRPTDILGRWGGDEFVALVDASGDVQNYISRINHGLSEEFVISSHESAQRVKVGAAVGVATWQPGESISEVLQRADAQMYVQKMRNVAK